MAIFRIFFILFCLGLNFYFEEIGNSISINSSAEIFAFHFLTFVCFLLLLSLFLSLSKFISHMNICKNFNFSFDLFVFLKISFLFIFVHIFVDFFCVFYFGVKEKHFPILLSFILLVTILWTKKN